MVERDEKVERVIGLLLGEETLRVSHLRLDSESELEPPPVRLVGEPGESVRKLRLVYAPVAESRGRLVLLVASGLLDAQRDRSVVMYDLESRMLSYRLVVEARGLSEREIYPANAI